MEFLTDIHVVAYAPLAIVIGGFIDVFFLTGYLAYGFALSSAVLMLYTAGEISYLELILASYIGTYLASLVNFSCGWFLATTPVVRKLSDSPRATRIRATLMTHNLFLAMILCRFVTVLRPAYLLLLGTLHISPRRVLLYEAVIAALWVGFWSTVLVLVSSGALRTLHFLVGL